MSYDGSKGYLAPAQAAVRFCLGSEVFPVFLAWLRAEFPFQAPEWFDPELVRNDLIETRDTLEPAERALADAGFVWDD